MFKSKKNNLNITTTDTLIGEGTVFDGKIKSEASIRIEGTITGDIQCAGDVAVGEKGVVKSHISARDVIIAGSVHGNVTSKGKVTITSKGKLYGNAVANSLVIDEGGIFQGTSKSEANTTPAPEQASNLNESVPPQQSMPQQGQYVPGAIPGKPYGGGFAGGSGGGFAGGGTGLAGTGGAFQ